MTFEYFDIEKHSGKSGIYCYENTIDGKKYIGQAVNLRTRIGKHENNLRKTTKPKSNGYLWNAVMKYGRNNFILYVLEVCPSEMLDEREIFYIREFESHFSLNGYNISRGGSNGLRNVPLKESVKRKLSVMFSGIGNPFYGKKHSDESNERNRKSHLGKTLSPEAIRKVSIATRRKNNGSSKYYGVVKVKHNKTKPFRAMLFITPKLIRLGYFSKETDAAQEYDRYVIENSLDYPLNF